MENKPVLYLYLDIDGVLNNRSTYEEYWTLLGEVDKEYVSEMTDEDYRIFNSNPDCNVFFFSNEKGWGEIIDKRLVEELKRFINNATMETKVVIVSSGAGILDNDSSLDAKYYSEALGINIIDWHAGGGSLVSRYKYMVNHFKTHGRDGDVAMLVDDLTDDSTRHDDYIMCEHGMAMGLCMIRHHKQPSFINTLYENFKHALPHNRV